MTNYVVVLATHTGGLKDLETRMYLTPQEWVMVTSCEFLSLGGVTYQRREIPKEGHETLYFSITTYDVSALLAASKTRHASTSPGPVNCNIRKHYHDAVCPRTCERCGLDPCPFFNSDGTAK